MPYADRNAKLAHGREYNKRPEVKARRRLLRATPASKQKARAQQLRWRYGLRKHEFTEILASQGGRCAICRATAPGSRDWHVDHDHVSGRVRGLLCSPCNTFIGLAKEDPDVLRQAAQYLDESLLRRDSNGDE